MLAKISAPVVAGLLAVACAHAAPYPIEEASPVLAAAKPGQAVELPDFAISDVPTIPYQKVILPGPQYIISDDPEYIRVPEGAALREEVEPGTVRLYVYNVNGIEGMPRRITAVIENRGESPMTIRMLRKAFPKPSGDYHAIGKAGLKGYFESKPEKAGRTVAPGGALPIDPAMEATIVNYNDLVHGFYEFAIDQPARITVLQTDPETPGAEAVKRIDGVIPSPRGNAGRGVFGVSNYLVLTKKEKEEEKKVSGSTELLAHSDYVLDPARGPVQLVLADGASDPWIIGIDGSTGDVAKLAGNYGVMYRVELPMKSSDPNMGYALVTYNARFGSQWCGGMANTIQIEGNAVSIPADKTATKSFPEVVVGRVYGPETEKITFTYSPPGASCLPTPIVFLPVRFE